MRNSTDRWLIQKSSNTRLWMMHCPGGRSDPLQIYLRSFKDSTGNGQGDLVGLSQKVEIFSQFLGIDCLWLSPIHPSPDLDHGYDVSDYRQIHPALGTLSDFDQLIEKTQKSGLKVILDGVFNHCSNQHPWFQSAIQQPDSSTRNFFHWHPHRQPPNNWASVMGGRAWTWSEQAQSSYLHTFLPEQPDLNWRNPQLVREVLDTLRFWLDRGVNGFRLDVFNCYVKDGQSGPTPGGQTFGVVSRVTLVLWSQVTNTTETNQNWPTCWVKCGNWSMNTMGYCWGNPRRALPVSKPPNGWEQTACI